MFDILKSGDGIMFADNTTGPEYAIVQQHIIDLLNGDMTEEEFDRQHTVKALNALPYVMDELRGDDDDY